MTATLTTQTLSDLLAERVRETLARLESTPFYARLLAGRVTRDEYAAWLVQMHKYVRYSEGAVRHLALAMAVAGDEEGRSLRAYAEQEADEEATHDDMILVDLARLWDVKRDAVRGRIEAAETAPSILTYSRLRETFLLRHPKAILGAAFCLETLSGQHADRIRAALVEQSGIEAVQRSTTFLRAHRAEVEEAHQGAAAARIDQLVEPAERSAAVAFGNLMLNMYEGIAFYLSQRCGG